MLEGKNKVELTANRFTATADGILANLSEVENRSGQNLSKKDRSDIDRNVKAMRDALRRLAVYRESLDEGNRHYLDKLVTLTKEKIYSRMEKLEGLLVGPSTSESKLQFHDEEDDYQLAAKQTTMPQIRQSTTLKYANEGETIKQLCSDIEEINEIMIETAKLVREQDELVDNIGENLERTQEHLHVGAKHLRLTEKLKIAAYPFAGAMIGAVAAGPVGLLVGLKLSGCAGCIVAGGALGAFGGRVIQKKVGGEMEFLQEETPVAVNSSCSAADKKSN